MSMYKNRMRELLWLKEQKHIGRRTIHSLDKVFDDLQIIRKMGKDELLQVGLSERQVRSILQGKLDNSADRIIEYCDKHQIHMIDQRDPAYNLLLKETADPPVVLFGKGNIDLLTASAPCVGIVGTRRPSTDSRRFAYTLGKILAGAGVIVVSGMAQGIDACAHQGALDGGGVTIAVLGGGVDQPYPKVNVRLYENICKRGLVISEYAPTDAPRPAYFPERNRIISGLCETVVVVEAAERSGSLITAQIALEQNREIMAVPGSVYDPSYSGTNRLIREGAIPILKPEDVLEDLGISDYKTLERVYDNLVQKDIHEYLQAKQAVNFEKMTIDLPHSSDIITKELLFMQLNGTIEKSAGNVYVLC